MRGAGVPWQPPLPLLPISLVCSVDLLSNAGKTQTGGTERYKELAKVTQEEGDGVRLEPRLPLLGMKPLVPIPPSLRCGHCVLPWCAPRPHTHTPEKRAE